MAPLQAPSLTRPTPTGPATPSWMSLRRCTSTRRPRPAGCASSSQRPDCVPHAHAVMPGICLLLARAGCLMYHMLLPLRVWRLRARSYMLMHAMHAVCLVPSSPCSGTAGVPSTTAWRSECCAARVMEVMMEAVVHGPRFDGTARPLQPHPLNSSA